MPLTDQQRFCPLCNRAFVEGEAVLRCEGCGVMHHPGCWVTNSGCATKSTHRSVPIAQAFTVTRHMGDPAPHPGEGTRVAPIATNEAAAPRPVVRPQMAQAPAPVIDEPVIGEGTPRPPAAEPVIGGAPAEWPVIGANPVPPQARREREPVVVRPPSPPRRYVPPEGEHQPKPMPKVYGRPSILAFWYIPVAVALAVVVALGVIWTSDRLFGGDDAAAPAATPTPEATPTATVTAQPSATASMTAVPASPSPARGSGTSTKFNPKDVAVVTGAGDCLNVRTSAGTNNPAIVCLKDGEEVTVVGGPEGANGLQWWNVSTKLGEGWAAEDYLVKK